MPRPRTERPPTVFLLVNVMLLLAVYAWLLVPILRDGSYLPAWTDEYGYVLDARSYAANGTLHAARLKEERVSRLLAAGTHGPAYIVVQGTIAKLFGDPVALSVWPNILVLAAALLLVLAFPLPLTQRLWIAVLLLLHFAVFLYTFTWMVETWQVLFAVAASLLLVVLYRARKRGRPGFRAALATYVILLLVLASFRVSYALWAIGLVPLARDRRELARYALLATSVVALGVLTMQALSASNPHWPLSRAVAALTRGDVADALALVADNVGLNLQRYFAGETQALWFYLLMKYAVLAVGAAALVAALRHGDRLALAACLILGGHLALLFLLYDAHSWREHRHLAPVFYLLIVAVVAGGDRRTTLALYALQLVLFPEVVGYVRNRIVPERRWMAREWVAADAARASLAHLGELEPGPGDGPITVLHAQSFYRNLSVFPLAIPVQNHQGWPIRYTGNLGMTPDTRRFGRIAIDYVVLPPEARPDPTWRRVYADDLYALYDLRPASGAATGGSPSPRSTDADSFTRRGLGPTSPSSAVRSSS